MPLTDAPPPVGYGHFVSAIAKGAFSHFIVHSKAVVVNVYTDDVLQERDKGTLASEI